MLTDARRQKFQTYLDEWGGTGVGSHALRNIDLNGFKYWVRRAFENPAEYYPSSEEYDSLEEADFDELREIWNKKMDALLAEERIANTAVLSVLGLILGAGLGAIIGFFVAGPIGAVVGAVIGAGVGGTGVGVLMTKAYNRRSKVAPEEANPNEPKVVDKSVDPELEDSPLPTVKSKAETDDKPVVLHQYEHNREKRPSQANAVGPSEPEKPSGDAPKHQKYDPF